jgi:hypothetical protein
MELRRTFHREANSHRMARRRVVLRERQMAEEIADFRDFILHLLADGGPGLHPGGTASLDEIKRGKGYCPGNIRWLDKTGQARNRSNVRMVRMPGGREIPLCEGADKRKLDRATVRQRVNRGWTPEEAISVPRGARRRAATPVPEPPKTTLAPRQRRVPLAPIIRATWEAAWAEAFPLAPAPSPWTRAERGQMQIIIEAVRPMKADPVDFIRFVVRRWRDIRATAFGWMKVPPPNFPNIAFLANWHRRSYVFDAYATHIEQPRINALSGEEGAMARMLAVGMSHDEALIEIGRQRAAAAGSEKVRKAREHLARTVAALEKERAALRAQHMALVPPAPPPGQGLIPRPAFDHGSNPFEAEVLELADPSTIGAWEDEP